MSISIGHRRSPLGLSPDNVASAPGMPGQYAFGRPSMMGDYMLDAYKNVSYMMHCGGPWNPWGDNRRRRLIKTYGQLAGIEIVPI